MDAFVSLHPSLRHRASSSIERPCRNCGALPTAFAVGLKGHLTGFQAQLLTEGVMSVLPRTLEVRPFSPSLGAITIMAGLPVVRSNPRAETFLRMLREGAANKNARF